MERKDYPLKVKIAAGALSAVVISAGIYGWTVTRPDTTTEFIPYPEAGLIVADAAIDVAIDVIDSSIDAAFDAAPDAATGGPLDFEMITVFGPEGATVEGQIVPDGADGVNRVTLGGKMSVVVPWEQDGKITVHSLTPGQDPAVQASWVTRILATVVSVEDARADCDLDLDGEKDIVAAGEGKRIRNWFGPDPWSVSAEIDEATNDQQWIQVRCDEATTRTVTADAGTDMFVFIGHGWSTGDLVRLTTTGSLPGGFATATNYWTIRVDASTFRLATSHANAIAGTFIDVTSAGTGTHTAKGGMRVWAGGLGPTAPATQAFVGFFQSGDPRVSSSWTWVPVAPVTWLMSIIPGDHNGDGQRDLFISDRLNTNPTITNKGVTLFTGPSWVKTRTYASNNVGDPKFMEMPDASTIYIGVSSSSHENRLIRCTTTNLWTSATCVVIAGTAATGLPNVTGWAYPANTGQYQGVVTRRHNGTPCDLNGDGVGDFVLTHAPSKLPLPSLTCTTAPCSGIVAIDGATGGRIEIDKGTELKHDNPVCEDIEGDGDDDVWSTGQNSGIGLAYYRNKRFAP